MRFQDLALFVDVVEAGGMTQAAARRGVSQPGISRAVRDVEGRLRAELLRRTGRGVELTAAGEVFLAFAREVLAAQVRAEAEIARVGGRLPEAVSLAMPLGIGQLVIPELHRRVAMALPGVTLHAFEERADGLSPALADGRYDTVIGYASVGSAGARPVFEESLYLVGLPRLIGEETRPMPLSEVAALPLLLPSAARYRGLVEGAFRTRGLTLRIARELETTAAMLAFAMEGEGAAILPFSNITRDCARGDVAARLIIEPTIDRALTVEAGRALDRRLAGPLTRLVRETLGALSRQARWRRVAGAARP